MKSAFKSLVVAILTAEAAVLIRRKNPKIIAITGNVGKTSTKDAIYTAVKGSVRARKSEKSFNSDIGVPLTVLGLPNGWSNPFLWVKNIIDGFFAAFFTRDYPEVLILETGIDRPGDMTKLTRWIKPDIVVLTRLPSVPVHVEYFSTPEAVVEEKMKLVSALKPNGKLIYNADDTIIEEQLEGVRHEQIGFSRYRESQYRAASDRVMYHDDVPAGVEFSITHDTNKEQIQIKGTLGTQHLYAVSAACAVAGELGITLKTAALALNNLQTPNGRVRIIEGIKGTTIIDDTYNSSPTAVESALLALKEIKYSNRKIAVLGDMLELGKYSAQEHKKIGELVAHSANILLTVGVRARHIAEGALATGMSEKYIYQYDDVARAGKELQNIIKTGDTILVKASQSLRAERIVEEVMARPELANKVLVRQDRAWKKIA